MEKAFRSCSALTCLILFSLLLSGCRFSTHTKTFEIYAFGTQISITLNASNQQVQLAKTQLTQTFNELHTQWHAWQHPSLLTQINNAISQGHSITLDESVKQLLKQITTLSNQSDQLFNPAIGHLIESWGFHDDIWQGPPPTENHIQKLLNLQPSLNDLYWEGTVLASRNRHVQIDLGGVAKGYAANIARVQLQQMGIKNALINIGGDVLVLGDNRGKPWRIGIKDPRNPVQALHVLNVCDGYSVFTSGTYERQYQWQQQRFHHILDPRTGFPAQGWHSVTVIHSDPLRADVAATALLIAGGDWQKIAQKMNIESVILIDDSRKITHGNFSKKTNCSNI